MEQLIKLLAETLEEAKDHLDYCGYGDKWERECAGDLELKIETALDLYNKFKENQE